MGNTKSTKQVVYKNDVDELGISTMSASQLNAFFGILSTLKGIQKEDPIKTYSFKEFRDLANLSTDHVSNSEMEDFLNGILPKIFSGYIKVKTEYSTTVFSLFDRITVNRADKTISIVVGSTCVEYFNNFLGGYYTSFPLFKLLQLKSKYAKILFKQLSRYKSEGRYECDYDQFIENILHVPKSVPRFKVKSAILTPAINELKNNNCFEDIKLLYTNDESDSRRYKNIRIEFKPVLNDKKIIEFNGTTNSEKQLATVFKEKEEINGIVNRYEVYEHNESHWEFVYVARTLELAQAYITESSFYPYGNYKVVYKSPEGGEKIVYTNLSEEELKDLESETLPF